MKDYLESIGGHGAIEFEDVICLSMADASLAAVAYLNMCPTTLPRSGSSNGCCVPAGI